ncbi:MAG: translation initiation factor IF-2 subunit gamma [Candidatus Aenigmatarchaeota archaeon]
MKVPEQPEINIGMVGHVDHGKTTLTEALSGEWTDRHSEETKRGISIRLGYADTAFYKCPNCEGSEAYTTDPTCPNCDVEAEFLRAISFVDSPGHETLMATMLTGASVMDGAVLVIAANEECPQPQTQEHLMGLDISGVENIVIVQNKVDLVTEEEAKENYRQIKEFTKGTVAEDAPIIPVSAHHDVNINILIEAIEEEIKTPDRRRNEDVSPRLPIARSFDINKPGTPISELKGAVIGGSLIQGILEIGDEIEIRPGTEIEEGGEKKWEKLTTTVETLTSGSLQLDEVKPGGLIGVGTKLDPSLSKSDSLAGKVAGYPGQLPPIKDDFLMEVNLFDKVVGMEKEIDVENIKTREPLMLTVGSSTTVGVVTSARGDEAEVQLKRSVCAEEGQRIAISRRIKGKWHLIGHGVIRE